MRLLDFGGQRDRVSFQHDLHVQIGGLVHRGQPLQHHGQRAGRLVGGAVQRVDRGAQLLGRVPR